MYIQIYNKYVYKKIKNIKIQVKNKNKYCSNLVYIIKKKKNSV